MMTLDTLGFRKRRGALEWRGGGVVEVVELSKDGRPRPYAQLCVLSPPPYANSEATPYLVATLSWSGGNVKMVEAWNLAATNVVRSSAGGDEAVPAEANARLVALREPLEILTWLQCYNGRKPPIYYWLTAIAAYWSQKKSDAMAAVELYLSQVSGDMLADGQDLRERIQTT